MFLAALFRPRALRTAGTLSMCLASLPAFAAGDEALESSLPWLGQGLGIVWPTLSWPLLLVCLVGTAFVLSLFVAAISSMKSKQNRYRRRLRLICDAIDHVRHGIIISDASRRVVYCNDQYLEIHRLSRADIRPGLTIADLRKLRERAGTFSHDISKQLIDSEDCDYIREETDGRCISVSRRPVPGGGRISLHEDFTEQRTLSRELTKTKAFLASIIDNIPLAVAVKTVKDRRYTLVNNAYLSFTGMSRERIIGSRADDLFSAATAKTVNEADHGAIESPAGREYREMTVERGRETRVLASNRVVIRNAKNEPEILVTLFDDITKKQALAHELENTKKFLEQIVDNLPIALTVKQASTREFLLVNRSAESILHKQREDIVGRTSEQVFGASLANLMDRRDDAAIAAGHSVAQESPVKTEEGTRLLLWRRVAVKDDAGEPQYLIQTSEDITERRRTESRMAHMAFHDSLTDLPNRSAFLQALDQMIDACAGTEDEFSVLSINLDRFKEINDVFGHARGDALLVEVAKCLQDACKGAVIARISGDEFGVIVDGAQPEAACNLADNLTEILRREFVIDGRAIRIGLTAGIAVHPRHGEDAASLLANAAAALFRAKSEARGNALVFEAKMDLQTRDRRAMQQELARAIGTDEICLHYQPQALTALRYQSRGDDTESAEHGVVGFEALARWNHPVRGSISPALFIPIAEESGLIADLGEWVLREACREAASWSAPLVIAVNISPAQFHQGDVAALVHSVLLETGLAPGRLELEITEGVFIRDFERGLSLLRRLKALGVRIAMDDFGTGYSSLSYLQSFPFDKIKIDRAFITKVGSNPQSAAIIRAVIGLGHGLDIPIVAEGVETIQQLEFLAEEDCDQIQGYFVGRPRPIGEYAWIVSGKRPATDATDDEAAASSDHSRKAG